MADVAELSIYILPSQTVSISENAILAELQQLLEEIQDLKAQRDQDHHEIRTLQDSLDPSLEALAHDAATDRKRISKLESPGPRKTELSRASKIERYLKERPDHRASFETLKGYLQIDNVRLNETIKTLMKGQPGRYTIIRVPGDKRMKAIQLLTM
jgi:DNA repair exonuclease SbcCD ATPase subunit